jgi:hypothetical protein
MSDPRNRNDDPDAPATEQDRAAADDLRQALEDPRRASDDAELARALSSAWSPRDLAAGEHRALVERALDRHLQVRRSGRVIRVSFGVGAIVALAAGVLLVLRSARLDESGVRVRLEAGLVVSRSTQPLFPDRFAPAGGETARIDRIAMARAADLRDNEFAKWGVR